jgi:hypothetical protein
VDKFDLVFIIWDIVEKIFVRLNLVRRGPFILRLFCIALYPGVWVCRILDDDRFVHSQLAVPSLAVSWFVVVFVFLVGCLMGCGSVGCGGVKLAVRGSVGFSHGEIGYGYGAKRMRHRVLS